MLDLETALNNIRWHRFSFASKNIHLYLQLRCKGQCINNSDTHKHTQKKSTQTDRGVRRPRAALGRCRSAHHGSAPTSSSGKRPGPGPSRSAGETPRWWTALMTEERTRVMNISERPRDTSDLLLTTNTGYCLLPYMTACLSTSLGLSVASSWGGTVSCQFWPSPTSSSSAAASGSSANGESTLLQGHTRTYKHGVDWPTWTDRMDKEKKKKQFWTQTWLLLKKKKKKKKKILSIKKNLQFYILERNQASLFKSSCQTIS